MMLLLSFRSEVKKRSYGTSRQLHNVRRAAYVAAADYGPAELASPCHDNHDALFATAYL